MRNKTILFVCLILAFIFNKSSVYGTAQMGDRLIYKGDTFRLYTNPLESFLEGKDSLRELIPIHQYSTACWRGYVALWVLEDSTLYLKGFVWYSWETRKDTFSFDLSKVFGNTVIKGKVKADWFTGSLRLPNGKMLEYVHMGYASRYAKEIIIEIERGKIAGIINIDNSEKKIPRGYKKVNLFYFTLYLPKKMLKNNESSQDSNYRIYISTSDKNRKLNLSGFAWTNRERRVSDKSRKEFLMLQIDTVISYIDSAKVITFGEKKTGTVSSATYVMRDGKNDKNKTQYRVMVFSNTNTNIALLFEARQLSKKNFVKIADNIIDSLNILEFGY